jgi:hypothetical protein
MILLWAVFTELARVRLIFLLAWLDLLTCVKQRILESISWGQLK